MGRTHIVKSYDEELLHLNRTIVEMGGVTEAQIEAAVDAVLKRDTERAQQIIHDDDKIDALNYQVDIQATRLLALRQPMAADLRSIVGALKISADLERIADYAANIAKRVLPLSNVTPPRPVSTVPRMSRRVQLMLKDVLDAYVERDADKAIRVWQADEEVDDMYVSLFRELLTYMMEDPRHITPCAHLLFIAKNLERMGDHITNISETIYFLVHGTRLREHRTKGGPGYDHDLFDQGKGSQELMKPVILVVEDEAALVSVLRYNLEREGFEVVEARDGEEAMLVADERPLDIVLLDWMLPNVSGIEVCRRLRRKGETANVPIVMLTARGEEADRIRGLDMGADDYVAKPFSMAELMARLHAVLRRVRPALAAEKLGYADIEMDLAAHRVSREGREVRLGPTEFRLLRFFLEHPGRVFSREQLIGGVWGHGVYVEPRTVDVHIRRLRAALNAAGSGDPIRTVRAAGYALDRAEA